MCSPEKQNGKQCSPCVYLMIGGTLLAIISMVAYMYLTANVSNNVDANKKKHVIASNAILSRQGSSFIPFPSISKPKKTCKDDTCGINATCEEGNCACPVKYVGNPTIKCEQLECVGDDDCNEDQACSRDYKCVKLCQHQNTCGLNATCDVISHTPVCSCPAGYTGNPFDECKVAGRENIEHQGEQGNPCVPSPCGPNSICIHLQDRPVCSCAPGYLSSPPNCRPECESDNDCGTEYACRHSRCVSPCIDCGENAHCNKSEHRAVCTCPTGYSGDPLTRCAPECDLNVNCPSERPACVNHACVDPCVAGTCGFNAHCSIINRIPICSCPANTTGNPFEYCRPLVSDSDGSEDIRCDPNPCGTNATCSLATDDDSKWYNCTCPPGFFGKPYISCQLRECDQDSECQEDKACTEYQCVDPCNDNSCGFNAVCTSARHRGICTCREGTIGNAFKGCFPPEMVSGISLIDGHIILRPPFNRIYSYYTK